MSVGESGSGSPLQRTDDDDSAAAHAPGEHRRFAATLASRVLLGALYIALAITLTWPLALHLDDHLPLGTEPTATVPLFNLWTLWWNVESLLHRDRDYWDAPIFHPERDTFALSEPQPLNGILFGAFRLVTDSPPLAYNLFLLAMLAANGAAVAALLRELGARRVACAGGGAIAVALPFVHQELGVAQLVPLVWVTLTLQALVRFSRAPGPRSGVWLGLAMGAVYAACSTYGLMLATLLTSCSWVLLLTRLRSRRTLIGLLIATAIASTCIAPIAIVQLRVSAAHGLERSEASVTRTSAQPHHWLRTAWPALVSTPGIGDAARPGGRGFWPGSIRVALAVVGLCTAIAARRFAVAGFLVGLTLVAVVLSLGPVPWWSPYHALRALIPGLEQMRNPFRFAMFAQLGVVVLASLGLDAITRRRNRLAPVIAVLVATLAVVEVVPSRQRLESLPPLDRDASWLRWIEQNTGRDDALAFLPLPGGTKASDYLGTVQWMYWQQRHGRPMVNGYSGFFPSSFTRLKTASQSFPDRATLFLLGEAGVRHCVVARDWVTRDQVERWRRQSRLMRATRGGPDLVWQYGDDQLDIYELVRNDGPD